ncbi:helix-turn-helix domain-containing protein [Streptomyces sp. bgisy022]|uniref:helix-turn-helix domain-containing protein n=1 Tax=Streptomyces sp. bgisy022 TaxID=3413769 RepID=UPI003D70B3D7
MSEQEEVARFAALLREFKERTDRSYGALARRLGMNTSTLHRYCAGEAVPVDFAPVERFAALCGATREERLELHHRWLLAAEARRHPRADGRTPAAGTGPAGAAGGTPGAAREPVPSAGPADTAEDTGPTGGTEAAPGAADGASGDTTPDAVADAGVDAGAVPEPIGDAVPGAMLEAVADADSDAVPEAVADAASDAPEAPGRGERRPAGTGAGPGPVPGPDGPVPTGSPAPSAEAGAPVSGPLPYGAAARTRSRPWSRRRRTVVAGAVACAVLTVVGTLAALPDGRRATADGERTAITPTASAAPTAPHRRAAPSASPSASPSPSTPDGAGGGGASSSPGTRRGSSPAATGPARAPAPDGPPLTWTVDDQVWAHGCGHAYVVDAPPERVPPPPAPQDAGAWARAQRAVHGGETIVELSVQGTSDTAVVLTALRVRVVGRGAPAQGNAYAVDQGCGGALTPRYFAVDLDKDRPLARPVAGNDAGTPIPAVRLPYRVSARDPEVLRVTARTGGCDCRWYLELDWSSQGRSGTVRVDDHGRPFRTSGVQGLSHYTYDTSGRRWVPRSG